MPIHVMCTCGAGFSAPDDAAGTSAKCPKCGAQLVIRPGTASARSPIEPTRPVHGKAPLSRNRWAVIVAVGGGLVLGLAVGWFAGREHLEHELRDGMGAAIEGFGDPFDSANRDDVAVLARPETARAKTLEVEVLKTYMASASHAAMDIRFINSSGVYLRHWAVVVEVYGPDDTYLARGEAMASHLQPGQSKVEQVLLLDTTAEKIRRYRITLDGIVGEPGLRIDDQFELEFR